MKTNYLFNVLIEKRIDFKKTKDEEYILYDFFLIISDHIKILDEEVIKNLENNFKLLAFTNGIIQGSKLEKLLGKVIDYEKVII